MSFEIDINYKKLYKKGMDDYIKRNLKKLKKRKTHKEAKNKEQRKA